MKTSFFLGLFLLTSCCISTGPTVPTSPGSGSFDSPSYPTGYPDSYPQNSYPQSSCVLYSHSQGTSQHAMELDLAGDIAQQEEIRLQQTQDYYVDKFNLSSASANKMAKAVWDFNRLQERSYEDMLDFAIRLYGVNPSDLTQAITLSQMGENQDLERLLKQAAQELGTNPSNMKKIIKTLHHDALLNAGIEL